MLVEYSLFFLLGILAGVVAGLLPGLHVNNIGVIMLSLTAVLHLDPITFVIFLASMSTAQSFINFIPSIFLGVPDEDTVLSLLPSHRLLLEGRGMEAVRITGIASLYGVVISLVLLPLAFFIVPVAYQSARLVVVPILMLAIGYLIIREGGFDKIFWALASFLLSGYLGWVCLGISTLSTSQVFLPMFSGLFGLSTLLTGIQAGSKLYPQDLKAEVKINEKSMWRNSLLGTIGGIIVGLLPAMSPSQIGIFLQDGGAFREKAKKRVADKLEDLRIRQFLATVASLNTADAMFSIFALYLIGNPRSGISVIMQDLFGQISMGILALICGVMLASALLAYKMHIFIGEQFSRFADRIDFQKLSILGFAFVAGLVFVTAGPLGIAIASVSTAIGLVPALTGVSRTHCMGCLLMPTMLFYLGLS